MPLGELSGLEHIGMYSSSKYLVSSITRYPGQVYLLLRGSQLARVVGMVGCEVNLLAMLMASIHRANSLHQEQNVLAT